MAFPTFGSTPAASTSQTVPNCRRLLIQCFAGTKMPSDATHISPTFRIRAASIARNLVVYPGWRVSARASGSLGVGYFKNCWPRHKFSSFLVKAPYLATNLLCNNKSMKLPVYRYLHLLENHLVGLTLRCDLNGRRTARPLARKIRHTAFLGYLGFFFRLYTERAKITQFAGSGMKLTTFLVGKTVFCSNCIIKECSAELTL